MYVGIFSQEIITQWNFNGPAGNTNPSIGSGSYTPIGGVSTNFFSGIVNGGSSDPVPTFPPNFALGLNSFPSQSTNSGSAGLSFNCNTQGFENILFRYDIRASETAASRWIQYEYTINGGIDWVIFGNNGGSLSPGLTWFNEVLIDFSTIPDANNNPNFGVRLVSIFSPVPFNPGIPNINYGANEAYHKISPDDSGLNEYSPNGTWRFDMVTFLGSCIETLVDISATNMVVCPGNPTQLTANSSGSFSWNTGQGGQSITVNPTETTTYIVTVTSGACMNTGEITITTEVTSTNPAGPLEACADANGDAVFNLSSLNNIINGGSGQTVTWFLNPELTIQSTSPSAQLILGSVPVPFAYAVINHGSNCASEPEPVELIVNDPATLSNPLPMSVCASGTPISLPAQIDGYTGTWNGPGVTGTSFNPSGLSGMVTLTFTPGANQCALQTGFEVAINDSPSPGLSSNSPVCPGGTIQLEATGGINYSWSGPSGFSSSIANPSIANATSANGGEYFVTVTDGNGCTATSSIEITLTGGNVNPVATATPSQVCVGEEVIFSVTPAGSNYNWQGPVFTSQLQTWQILGAELSDAGTYFVTVTDADGCTGVGSVVLSVEAAPTANATSNSPVCAGNTLELSASGGNSYAWSGPGGFSSTEQNPTISSITSTNSGQYVVTVTSGSNCTSTAAVSVTVTPGFSISTSNEQDVSCPGENDGAFTLNIQGVPSPPINFEWEAPPGFNPNLGPNQNLPPGVYGITVTDGNGCVGSANLVISEPEDYELSCVKLADESSAGAEDGIIQVSLTGDDNSYSIAIIPPNHPGFTNVSEGVYNFDNLPSGTYTITATDENGCTKTCVRTINSGDCPNIVISLNPQSLINLDCAEDTNGQISVTVIGGQDPYIYEWTPDVSASNVSGNLGVGSYSVFVTDQNGCEASLEDIFISAPDPLFLFCMQQSPASASGSEDGVALIDISGGIAPYTVFSVAGPTNINLNNIDEGSFEINNLSPGFYTIIITDSNGCEENCSFEIFFSDCQLFVAISITNDVSCNNGNDGALLVEIFDAIGAVSYAWSPAAIPDISNPSNLAPGSYSVTVTDQAGCTSEDAIDLFNPFPLELLCNAEPVSQPGEDDGSIVVNIAGISNEFLIEWSGPESGSFSISGDVSYTITDLSGGIYQITVTDDNGCTSTCQAIVSGEGCIVSGTSNNISCHNADDGTILVLVEGATGTVNFNWTGPVPIANDEPNPTGLPSGNYSVTVTDEDGCNTDLSFTIINPIPLELICVAVDATTGNDNGELIINVNGGIAGYTIVYNGAASGQVTIPSPGVVPVTMLPIGIYTITVTDNNGCTNTCEAEILESSCTINSSFAHPTCFASNDGRITLIPSGTTGEITYTWVTPIPDEIPSDVSELTGLPPGEYFITVTDEGDCNAQFSFTLVAPDQIVATCVSQNASPGESNGSITVTVSGGTPEYNLEYTGPSAGNIEDLNNDPVLLDGLPAGTYIFSVTDVNNCTGTCSASIEEDSGCDFSISCSVVSNETATGANDGIASITFTPSGETVTIMFQLPDLTDIVIGPIPVDDTYTIPNLTPGIYTIRVTNEEGCEDQCTFIILPFSPCNLGLILDQLEFISCHGESNAVIRFDLTGNVTDPVNIILTPGNVSLDPDENVVENLSAGLKTLSVVDGAGCTTQGSIQIDQPDPLFLSCSTVGNGSIARLSWAGGTGNINFTLTDASGMEIVSTSPVSGSFIDIEDLDPGIYTAIITDENGCNSNPCQFSITTEECEMTLALALLSPILCFGDATAVAEVSVMNGSAPFIYEWNDNNIGNTPSAQNLTSGSYAVTVTDANDCINVAELTINEPLPLILANCIQLEAATEGSTNGSGRLVIQGGTPGYTLFRNGPSSNAEVPIPAEGISTVIGLEAGLHEFVLVDENGCETACDIFIEERITSCQLAIELDTIVNNLCVGDSRGSITIAVLNAVGNATIEWETGQNTTTISSLRNGTYSITVTDEDNCVVIDSFVVASPPGMTSSWSVLEASCTRNEPTANLIRVEGGTPPYSLDILGTTFPGVPGLLNYPFEHNTSYPARLTDSNGCNVTINLNFGAPDTLTMTAIPSFTINPGQSIEQVLTLNKPRNTVNIDLQYNGEVICTGCGQLIFTPEQQGSGLLTATLGSCLVNFPFTVIFTKDPVDPVDPPTFGVYVPTAFSPNLDGVNDLFEPYFDETVQEVEFFRVFDRWGNLMHEVLSSPPTNGNLGWNGRYRGQLLESGVFVYSMSVRFNDGSVRQFAGEVAIYR